MPKPKLLLHVCCAPCSTHVIETLKEDFDIVAYFYNPNIHPIDEYKLRLENLKKLDVKSIEGKYDVDAWFRATRGYENEPEGGRRCELCYRLRMGETAMFAKDNGYNYFATTLTTSPYKNARVINEIGKKLSKKYGVKFYSADFKERNGFKKSVELSKKYELYRQRYCGCVFSKGETPKKSSAK
ncbi:MAG: epoxyqueuosine reductase QueH [Candidatus Hydrothermarchaeota archaeon]|nr:epoxyqueuosine reductase QueH [Candidatus Hydrothermarchaeota archaeon]